MSAKPRPVLARRIFWDVDFEQLDYDAKASFIIERVFAWGDVPDVRAARRYYGDDRIREVLLSSDEIPFGALVLISALFDRPIEAFRSFRKGEGRDPGTMRRAYFEKLHAIHGLPPPPPPDPALMRMS
ncbi:MAG: hypothetical protein RBT71_01630 [Flavobacteriales bacterium]|nr:hypothetical protein [Flavobacteriales bacterium]